MFTPNEEITSAVLSDLLLEITTSKWLSTNTINATVYEASIPTFINDLRPASMWKGHAVMNDGMFVADAYSPLESFVKYSNGTTVFNPIQNQVTNQGERNYGGTLPDAILPLLTPIPSQADIIKMRKHVEKSEVLDTNTLYFIQNSNLISKNFGGAQAESFTLHFE